MIAASSAINTQAVGVKITPATDIAARENNKPTDKAAREQTRQEVKQLKQRDQEVRTHEQAHLSAAGGLAHGGPSFTFVTGPDGRRYAVGGEVSISVSPVAGDPVATLQKAEQIKRAALAPAQPSSQDQRVAAKAAAMQIKAQMELLKQNQNDNPNTPAGDRKSFDISV